MQAKGGAGWGVFPLQVLIFAITHGSRYLLLNK